jgi:hypothetical protein
LSRNLVEASNRGSRIEQLIIAPLSTGVFFTVSDTLKVSGDGWAILVATYHAT